jgi:hypothetical protein
MTRENHISVSDWRRRPPLRLRVSRKLKIHWCWIKCTRCSHMRAVAIAPYGSGGDRTTARCTACGKRGVALQHPSWGGTNTGWAPMPISQMAPVPQLN